MPSKYISEIPYNSVTDNQVELSTESSLDGFYRAIRLGSDNVLVEYRKENSGAFNSYDKLTDSLEVLRVKSAYNNLGLNESRLIEIRSTDIELNNNGSIAFNGEVTDVIIVSGGLGYSSGELYTKDIYGSGFKATYTVDKSGVIDSITVINSGTGYISPPVLLLTPASNYTSEAILTPIMSASADTDNKLVLPLQLKDTGVSAGSYTSSDITVDSTGRITSISNGTGGANVEDAEYSVGWDGDTTNAPSQNAVYDKISSIDTTLGTLSSANISDVSANADQTSSNTCDSPNVTHTGDVTGSTALALDVSAISGQSLTTFPVGTDEMVINDNGVLAKARLSALPISTTTQTALDAKLPLIGGTMSGHLNMGGFRFTATDRVGFNTGTGYITEIIDNDDMSSTSSTKVSSSESIKAYVDNYVYPGQIIGYSTMDDTDSHYTKTLTIVFAVTDANHYVTFIAPTNGKAEIMVQIYLNSSTLNETVTFGLSDSATYNSLGLSYEQVVSYADETDDRVIQVYWILTDLTGGDSYTLYLGAKATPGTTFLTWGGTISAAYVDFIMKAVALP